MPETQEIEEVSGEIVDFNDRATALAEKDYTRSNFIISSKFGSSLLENKLMAIALAKLSDGEYHEDKAGYITVSMKASEIKYWLNNKSGSLYERLDEVSSRMTGRTIAWQDPEKKVFAYMAVITDATYINSVYSIKFNNTMRKYLINLKNNFSILSLPIMLSFKNNSSFRLYEILKSGAYAPKGKPDTGVYRIDYNLIELKMELGIINAETTDVRRILEKSSDPDYEAAASKALEHRYDRWKDFKRWVLDVALKEINENTDLEVKYDTIGAGRGGKIYKVLFTVRKKNFAKVLSEDQILDFIFEVREVLGAGFNSSDCRKIAEAANYDMEKIKRAAEAFHNNGDVKNPVGFIIQAMKEGYKPAKAPVKKKTTKRKANTPELLNQRKYDYEQLELKLLSQ